MSRESFISQVAPIIQKENSRRGNPLFNSVVIAQSCLESGYGASNLMMKANAIFGIKASKNWKGKVYNAKTKECFDGYNLTEIVDCFRAYSSLEESVSDYFDLITKSERYKRACNTSSKEDCITEIKNGGYATDNCYVDKVLSIIIINNLEKYDTENIDIDKIVSDVINGKYGNGEERKEKLGSLYNEVQKKVNERLLNNSGSVNETISVGDKVKVLKNEQYNGGTFKTYYDTYDVIEVKGDRIVIGIGNVITTAINISNIKKV